MFLPDEQASRGNEELVCTPVRRAQKDDGGHAKVGRTWHGKILQLITGSTGLDDWEWGVTLLAHDPGDIKGIVYEMRFDPVTAHYGEFGEFFIGLQVPLDELFRRVLL